MAERDEVGLTVEALEVAGESVAGKLATDDMAADSTVDDDCGMGWGEWLIAGL